MIIGILCFSASYANIPNDTIRQDCNDMVDFFKSTLYENYGDSLAFKRFWDAHQAFNGNYILQVNREKLSTLVRRIHERTWKGFVIGFPPEEDYDNADDIYWGNRTVLNASAINAITLIHPASSDNTHPSYYSECLAKATHPYLKHVYRYTRQTGQLGSYNMRTDLLGEHDVFNAFREGNQEIQLLITIYVWSYLCHCANIDVYSGGWRDELIDNFTDGTSVSNDSFSQDDFWQGVNNAERKWEEQIRYAMTNKTRSGSGSLVLTSCEEKNTITSNVELEEAVELIFADDSYFAIQDYTDYSFVIVPIGEIDNKDAFTELKTELCVKANSLLAAGKNLRLLELEWAYKDSTYLSRAIVTDEDGVLFETIGYFVVVNKKAENSAPVKQVKARSEYTGPCPAVAHTFVYTSNKQTYQ